MSECKNKDEGINVSHQKRGRKNGATYNKEFNERTKKPDNKKKIIIAILLVVILLAVIITTVILMKKSNKPDAEAIATESDATEEVTTEVAKVTTEVTTEVTTTEIASGGRKETTEEKSKKTTKATTEASSTKTPETKTPSTQKPTTQAPATEAPRPKPATEAHSHRHNYNTLTLDTATCTEDGVKIYQCSCGAEDIQVSPAKGHNYKTVTETVHHPAEYETRPVLIFPYDGYKCYTQEAASAHQNYLIDQWELAGYPEIHGNYENYSNTSETVLVKEAWDEQVTCQKCSVCGATK